METGKATWVTMTAMTHTVAALKDRGPSAIVLLRRDPSVRNVSNTRMLTKYSYRNRSKTNILAEVMSVEELNIYFIPNFIKWNKAYHLSID